MRFTLIVISLVLITGCKYSDRKRLMSNDIDTLLYSQTDGYVEKSKYEKDLSSIRSEMNLKIDSVKMLLEKNTTFDSNRFHVIVGSFNVAKNAERYSQKMKDAGYDGTIISGKNGYQMVTTKSFNNLRTALDNLSVAKQSVTENAWVYISK